MHFALQTPRPCAPSQRVFNALRHVAVGVVSLRRKGKENSVNPLYRLGPQLNPMVADDESQQEQQQQQQQQWQQQQRLAKAWNFLAGASGVFLFPYLNLYLAQRGLSSSQIGLLAALRPWLSAPIGMIGSALADKHQIHAQLLVATAAASILLRSCLPLGQGVTVIFTMLLVAELAGAPTNILADSTVLSNCKDSSDYGKQRQWASIGYGLASLPAGWLISSTGLKSAFLVYGLASLPLLLVGSQMTYNYKQFPASSTSIADDGLKQEQWQRQQQQSISNELEQPLLDQRASAVAAVASADAGAASDVEAEVSSLRQLLVKPRVLVFLWRCLLMGFAMGVMMNYEFLWLKQLGAPETLMGLAIAMSICTEVPAFTMQGAILQRFSAQTALNIVLAATALRLACYAALPMTGSVWLVLPVELLHGVTFGVGWGTATVYSSKLAPQHLSASMQGLFQATYGGVGAGLGGLAGGLLLDRFGGQGLFLTAAAIVASGCAIGVLADSASSLFPQHGQHKPDQVLEPGPQRRKAE